MYVVYVRVCVYVSVCELSMCGLHVCVRESRVCMRVKCGWHRCLCVSVQVCVS